MIDNSLLDNDTINSLKDIKNLNEIQRAKQDKIGFDLGIKVLHPLTNKEIPVWVANFVLASYGGGAVMSVPAHDERDFEFATKYNLDIIKVIKSNELPYTGKGTLINSQEFNGLENTEARKKIIELFQKRGLGNGVVNFKLRDWGISRQRYWGAPIPFIHCDSCGLVAEDIKIYQLLYLMM